MRGLWFICLLLVPLAAAAQHETEGGTAPEPEVRRVAFAFEDYEAGDRIDITLGVEHVRGIRGQTLLMTGPDGAEYHPDACTRGNMDINETPTYAENVCSVHLPRSAMEGTYQVDRIFVTAADNKPFDLVRGVNWTAGPGITPSVQVNKSAPDTTPPALRGLMPLAEVVEGGQNITFEVRAEDNVGLNRTTLYIDDPDGGTLSTTCQVPGVGVVKMDCLLEVPETAPGGGYSVRRVELADQAGNVGVFRRGVELVPSDDVVISFNVTEFINDTTPPVLLAYTTQEEPVRGGGVVSVGVEAQDQLNITTVAVLMQSMETGATFQLRDCGTFNGTKVAVECTAVIGDDLPFGRYRVGWIYLADEEENGQYYPVGLPPEDAPDLGDLLDDLGFTFLPGTLRTTGGSGEGLVGGLAPTTPDAVPGSVIGFVVVPGEGHTLQNVSFRLASSQGALLGSQDCPSDRWPLPGAFVCRVIVPPDAPKTLYVLEELRVRADGDDWVPVDLDQAHAPRLFVGESAPGLDGVPDDWVDHVQGGITLSSYRGPVLVPLEPVSSTAPLASTTSSATTDTDDSPLPVALALGALAVALRRRLGS